MDGETQKQELLYLDRVPSSWDSIKIPHTGDHVIYQCVRILAFLFKEDEEKYEKDEGTSKPS